MLAGAVTLVIGGAAGDRALLRLSAPEGFGWIPVASAAETPPGTVKRFVANDMVGHLMNIGGKLWALSAVCTHQACLLDWEPATQLFACNCHGAAFNANGTQHPIPTYDHVLQPLTRMPTATLNGRIFVQLPPPDVPSISPY